MYKRGSSTATSPRDASTSKIVSKNTRHRAHLACPWFVSVWVPTSVVEALVSWLRLAGDEDGGGIPPSSSWLRTHSREGMDRTRMVVGSSHLAWVQTSLWEGSLPSQLPTCTLRHPTVAPSAPRCRVIVVASSLSCPGWLASMRR
jgi:hypothetical protein